MYVVKLEIHPIRDGEIASGAFVEEKLRNGTWIRVREFPFVSSDGTGVRNFALDDDSRLVIGARSNVETRMDRAQNAHVTVRPNSVDTQGRLVHPQAKKYIPPRHEDEGTNDTGVSLAEQSAWEFEEMKRREMLERVRRENEARAKEAAAVEAAREAERKAIPPIRVREAGE